MLSTQDQSTPSIAGYALTGWNLALQFDWINIIFDAADMFE